MNAGLKSDEERTDEVWQNVKYGGWLSGVHYTTFSGFVDVRKLS